MNKIKVKIISPDKMVFEGEAQLVIARAIDGDIGIMFNHEPIIIPLGIGALRLKNGAEYKYFSHSEGFLKVLQNQVTIIVDSCESPESIDVDRAMIAADKARNMLESTQDADIARAEIKLKKALNRLEVVKYLKK